MSDSARGEPRLNWLVAGVVLLTLVTGGLWLAGKTLGVGPFTCTGYSFDPTDWRTSDPEDRLDDARSIEACGDLVGSTPAQVRSQLGAPANGLAGGPRQWHYSVGMVNDFMGPGDAGYLFLRFDHHWKVDLVEAP